MGVAVYAYEFVEHMKTVILSYMSYRSRNVCFSLDASLASDPILAGPAFSIVVYLAHQEGQFS